jgi:glycosyltransferase involved in cell wall biosynthesis
MPETILIVAHGHPELSAGGAELAAYSLFQQLQRTAGLKPYFLAWAGPAPHRRGGTPFSTFRGRADEILFATDVFDHFLFSQPTDLMDQFAALLQRIAPDVVHFHHYSKIGLEFIALVRRLMPSARIIVTLHEYLALCHNYGQMIKTGSSALCDSSNPHDCATCFNDIPPTEFLLRALFIKSHFDKVDLFIAPSNFLRQRYIEWGMPSWQIVYLENGTAPVEPAPAPRPRAAGERRAVFGFFGQINVYKGLLQLLTAFDYLGQAAAETPADMRLVVHGAHLDRNPPDFVESLRTLLDRNTQRVHFAGPYQRMALGRLMAAVDWVVVPSIWWENSPLVIQEAFAHRRPVICSNIGGMAEKVRRGRDGFHFQVGDPFDLAALMLRLAKEDELWDQLQKTIQIPVTIAESAARHLALYRDSSFAVVR